MSSWSIIFSTELREEEEERLLPEWLMVSGSLNFGLLLMTPIVLL